MFGIYPLEFSHSHGIDGLFIDGLPINSMVIFHGELLNNQMVIHWNVESPIFRRTKRYLHSILFLSTQLVFFIFLSIKQIHR